MSVRPCAETMASARIDDQAPAGTSGDSGLRDRSSDRLTRAPSRVGPQHAPKIRCSDNPSDLAGPTEPDNPPEEEEEEEEQLEPATAPHRDILRRYGLSEATLNVSLLDAPSLR